LPKLLYIKRTASLRGCFVLTHGVDECNNSQD